MSEYALLLAALAFVMLSGFLVLATAIEPTYQQQTSAISTSALNGYDDVPMPKATLPAPHPFPGPTTP